MSVIFIKIVLEKLSDFPSTSGQVIYLQLPALLIGQIETIIWPVQYVYILYCGVCIAIITMTLPMFKDEKNNSSCGD